MRVSVTKSHMLIWRSRSVSFSNRSAYRLTLPLSNTLILGSRRQTWNWQWQWQWRGAEERQLWGCENGCWLSKGRRATPWRPRLDILWAVDKWGVNDSDVSIRGQEFVKFVTQKRNVEQRAGPAISVSVTTHTRTHWHSCPAIYARLAERPNTSGGREADFPELLYLVLNISFHAWPLLTRIHVCIWVC